MSHSDTDKPRRESLGLRRAAVRIATAVLCAVIGGGAAVGGEAAGLYSVPSPLEQCDAVDNDDD